MNIIRDFIWFELGVASAIIGVALGTWADLISVQVAVSVLVAGLGLTIIGALVSILRILYRR